MSSKAVLTNQFGAYALDLHEDGTVTVIRFDPAPPGRRFRGLGDVIAAGTSAVGIPACKGCKDRQAALNRLVPFGPGESAPAPAPGEQG